MREDMGRWLVPFSSAFLCLLLSFLINRNGIEIWPDGWAYWQGSASILDGEGFRYFSGNRIMAWPPLYSLYLAGFTVLSGRQASGLVIANALLAALQAFAWTWLALRVWQGERTRPALAAAVPVAVFVAAFIGFHERNVFAQNLLYAILPFQLFFLWRVVGSGERHLRRDDILLAVTAALMMATHYSSVAFIATACFFVLLFSRRPLLARLSTCLLTGGSMIAAYVAIRWALQQEGSHKVGPGTGLVSVTQNLIDAANGLKQLLLPTSTPSAAFAVFVAAVVVVGVAARGRTSLFAWAYVIVSAVCLALLFSNTLILNSLDGRFIFYMPLVVVPVAMLDAASLRPAGALVLLALLLPVLAIRIANNRSTLPPSAMDVASGSGEIPSAVVLPWAATLSRVPPLGTAQVTEGRLLVAPLRWEEPLRGRP